MEHMNQGKFLLFRIHNFYFYFKNQKYNVIEPMISMSYDYKL